VSTETTTTDQAICQSTFTPPWDAAAGKPRRTYRCDGTPDHRGDYHGGPADDDPSIRAGWPVSQEDAQHPGEATIISLSEVRAGLRQAIDQRDKVIAAWRETNHALELIRSLRDNAPESAFDQSFGARLGVILDNVPAWARPHIEPTADAAIANTQES